VPRNLAPDKFIIMLLQCIYFALKYDGPCRSRLAGEEALECGVALADAFAGKPAKAANFSPVSTA
jgi:hypothetical protein